MVFLFLCCRNWGYRFKSIGAYHAHNKLLNCLILDRVCPKEVALQVVSAVRGSCDHSQRVDERIQWLLEVTGQLTDVVSSPSPCNQMVGYDELCGFCYSRLNYYLYPVSFAYVANVLLVFIYL